MKPNYLKRDHPIYFPASSTYRLPVDSSLKAVVAQPAGTNRFQIAFAKQAEAWEEWIILMKYIVLLLMLLLVSFGLSAQREFKTTEGDTTYTMKRYVFMMLVKGENTSQDSIKAVNIQKGHMAHINKMAESGKLVAAGPFEKGDRYRGLLVFDLETVEEAVALESEDPAVKAGRLKMETFYWWAAKGTVLK